MYVENYTLVVTEKPTYPANIIVQKLKNQKPSC